MGRKKAETLSESREEIRRKVLRGVKTEKRVSSTAGMDVQHIEFLKAKAVLLKASDFGTQYIATACGVTTGVVRGWFDEPEMRKAVASFQASLIEGGIQLLKTYAIEFIELLAEIARTADDKTALAAIESGLDRMGITKVNKSESQIVTTAKNELELADSAGMIEMLKNASPEVQQAAAQKMADLAGILSEHGGS